LSAAWASAIVEAFRFLGRLFARIWEKEDRRQREIDRLSKEYWQAWNDGRFNRARRIARRLLDKGATPGRIGPGCTAFAPRSDDVDK